MREAYAHEFQLRSGSVDFLLRHLVESRAWNPGRNAQRLLLNGAAEQLRRM
jgi:hypothetical protein